MTARLGVEVSSVRGRRRKPRLAKTLRAVNARVGVLPLESDPLGSGSYVAFVKRPPGGRMRSSRYGSHRLAVMVQTIGKPASRRLSESLWFLRRLNDAYNCQRKSRDVRKRGSLET